MLGWVVALLLCMQVCVWTTDLPRKWHIVFQYGQHILFLGFFNNKKTVNKRLLALKKIRKKRSTGMHVCASGFHIHRLSVSYYTAMAWWQFQQICKTIFLIKLHTAALMASEVIFLQSWVQHFYSNNLTVFLYYNLLHYIIITNIVVIVNLGHIFYEFNYAVRLEFPSSKTIKFIFILF